jgi:hypothetical protein
VDGKAERRPRREGGAPEAHAGSSAKASITAAVLRCWSWRALHACGCGIAGDCLLHQPLPVLDETPDWGAYDVTGLGLVPHDRTLCEPCGQVGQ